MHKLYFIPFLVASILSINSIAFEDIKDKININFVYKINASFDDLVLTYCSSYDSYTINRLYSERKIQNLNFMYKIVKKDRLVSQLIIMNFVI